VNQPPMLELIETHRQGVKIRVTASRQRFLRVKGTDPTVPDIRCFAHLTVLS
jgi:hypothetical protein